MPTPGEGILLLLYRSAGCAGATTPDARGCEQRRNGRDGWIAGIHSIDNMLVGNQDLLPKELKENKGHNVFYCLPLLLGIIGLLWQAYRGQKGIQQFWWCSSFLHDR